MKTCGTIVPQNGPAEVHDRDMHPRRAALSRSRVGKIADVWPELFILSIKERKNDMVLGKGNKIKRKV